MNPIREQFELLTRRHFFGRTGLSLGTAALSTLLAGRTQAGRRRIRRGRRLARAPSFPPQGQTGHLSSYEWRPVADGSL